MMAAAIQQASDVQYLSGASPAGNGVNVAGLSEPDNADESHRSIIQYDDHTKEVTLPELRTTDSFNRNEALPTSLQSDFLPEELLVALVQPKPPHDKLGLPSRYRNLNTTAAQGRKAPANVWNYPKRRDKFKHLTKNTPCVCGAGSDISFLYDVPNKEEPPSKPSDNDPSAIRKRKEEEEGPKKKGLALPDTLIPEEYHVVKNKGVMGLEFHEEKFSTQPDDHENHLVVFPSMAPASRAEVIQLKQALHTMLDKAGINDESLELRGPTQMHNLLELIKKEQNIYNLVFHELIRQSSVECLERGELLSELRDRYSQLLSKVPLQIKGLHEEVLAQRALDRRLTEELLRFKSTIGTLTSELSDVKEHDEQVTLQATQAQEDLKSALSESQKNASLLAEYHDLYELQRQRLEKQVSALVQEKELWSTAAYSLALKVMEEHSLNTAKRLHVSEKSWVKLARHFTVLLSDQDTELLARLQGHVDRWRDLVEDFSTTLKQREAQTAEELAKVKAGILGWVREFQRHFLSKEGHLLKPPDKDKITQLYADIRTWEQALANESECFGGETLVAGQDSVFSVRDEMHGWTTCAVKVFGRHKAEDGSGHPDKAGMEANNQLIDAALKQLEIRFTGENGVATGVIHMSASLEAWDMRLNTLLHGSNPLPDQEWLRFYQLLDDWIVSLQDTVDVIGTTQSERDRNRSQETEHETIDVAAVMRSTQKWVASVINGIDSEDAKLVEAVSSLHAEMMQWMVQVLLRLAPDRKEHSPEALQAVLVSSATYGQLQATAKSLFSRLQQFSRYVTMSCEAFVEADLQKRLDAQVPHADQDYRDLKKLTVECSEWVSTAKLLLTELTGESYTDTPLQDPKALSTPKEGQVDAVISDENADNTAHTEEVSQAVTQETPAETTREENDAETVQSSSEDNQTHQQESPSDQSPETKAVVNLSAPLDGEEEIAAEGRDSDPTSDPPTDPPSDPPIDPTSDPTSDPPTDPTSDPKETLEVIGYDANTHKRALRDAESAPAARPLPVARIEPRPDTPNTQRAFEALSAVATLQGHLLAAEERAQQAEERASGAELQLKQVQEQLRALERQVVSGSSLTEEPATSGPSPAKPTPTTTATTAAAATSPVAKTADRAPAKSTGKAPGANKVKDGEKSDAGKSRTTSRSNSRHSARSRKK